MKSKNTIWQLAAAVFIAGIAVSAMAGDEKEETVTMDQVPQKVKDTLKTYAADTDVKTVEKGDEDGKTVYEFDIEQGTRKFEVAITPKGKYMGTEEDVAQTSMPDAVQKALTDQAGSGTISGCEMDTDRHGKVTYEADVTKDGKKSELTLDATGKILSTEAGADKD